MPTSARVRASRWLLGALLLATPAAAQVRVDALTEVRRIRFEGTRSVSKRQLEEAVRTKNRASAYGLRVALGKIPLVPPPGRHAFSPLTLQEDVVRLRGVYAAAGFFQTQVRYQVDRDDAKNLLDITFLIEEGAPVIVEDVTVRAQDSLATLMIPKGEQRSWKSLERSILAQRGKRLSVDRARELRERLGQWWRDRGHPHAAVTTRAVTDSAGTGVRLTYGVAPGAFARFGDVQVEGNRSISDQTVLRLVKAKSGEPYSEADLRQSELDLQELDILRFARVDAGTVPAPDSAAAAAAVDSVRVASTEGPVRVTGEADSARVAPTDSLPPVRVRVTEAERRFVRGALGYVTDAGLSAEARWTNRNFSGGGRSLTATALAQTGWLALVENPDIRYRFALSLKQPAILNPRTSGVLTPFVEHRDDTQDRSNQIGLNTTLIHKFDVLKTISLDYQIARRHVQEYRFEDIASGEIDLLTFLTQAAQGLLDSLGSTLNTSTFTLSGSAGSLDQPANPRRGVIVRPALQITAPTSISSTAYGRVEVSANGFVPFGDRGLLATRVRVGRLYPFGKSLPGVGDDPQTKFLQLRDASFTAGGTGDVRGWENRLLGPKVPDVRFSTVGDSLVPRAEGYVPMGGFGSTTFSVEARIPLPGFGNNLATLLFLDGGRVWTDDERFEMQGDPNGQEKVFFATGGGFSLRTPVGPVEISAGYKLNPSVTDVVDASDILLAAAEGRPFDTLPKHNNRRWQLHLSIGASY